MEAQVLALLILTGANVDDAPNRTYLMRWYRTKDQHNVVLCSISRKMSNVPDPLPGTLHT